MSLVKPFQRLAVVNRGEPAMRLIRAVRDYNQEHGTELRTIALYTTPDRDTQFVRSADETYHLGEATYPDPETGRPRSIYLDLERLESALVACGCDAVWPGWGTVAENPRFAELCERLGLVFVGPPAEPMEILGDKTQAKKLAQELGIPVSPWSEGTVDTLEEAREKAASIGYPLMVKAATGGGGRGIRVAQTEAELEWAFTSARSEALHSFDEDQVFLEARIQGARHVEVEVLADDHGSIWPLGIRDCSVQRRHQKILEESPSPVLEPEEEQLIQEAAIRLVQAVGYRSVGTVEFLFRTEDRSFTFLEMNPRLQVEHPVTEMRNGIDLVKLQLQLAMGGKLEGPPPVPRGHAVEVRLNTEDADRNFAPSPGTLGVFQLPSGPGIRADMGFEEGDSIAGEFDSMIGKIVAFGATRTEAFSRLSRAVGETSVVVEGGTSNRGFLFDLSRSQDLAEGKADTDWLDQKVAEGKHRSRRHADLALALAAVEFYQAEQRDRRTRFLRSAERGRPEVPRRGGVRVDLELATHIYRTMVHRTSPEEFRIEVDGETIRLRRTPAGRHRFRVRCGERSFRVLSKLEGDCCFLEIDGGSSRVFLDRGGVVRSPSPAVVASVAVSVGDKIEVGDPLVVLEAMKLELQVNASQAGTVRELSILANQQVGAQEPLLVIDPSGERVVDAKEPRVTFADLARTTPEDPDWATGSRNLEDLRSLILGYDVDAGHLKQLLAERGELCADLPDDDPRLMESEDQILAAYTDLLQLFGKGAPSHSNGTEEDIPERRTHEEYLYTYLRDIAQEGADLPASFRERLRNTVRHYGIDSLTPTPALEECLFRIWSSLQCLDERVVPILSLLQRRLDNAELLAPAATPEQRALLDRIIASSRHRPAVCELAVELRYQLFDEPLLLQRMEEGYEEMQEHLSFLAQEPQAEGREERIQTLVDFPHPLKNLTSRLYAQGDTGLREVMLEVLTRRFFRNRNLENLRVFQHQGRTVATADYQHWDFRFSVYSASASYAGVPAALEALTPLVAEAPEDRRILVDVFAWKDEAIEDADATRDEILEMLRKSGLRRDIQRITVALSTPDNGPQEAGIQIFNFRPNGEGYKEDRPLRGIHARLGERLDLWRLKNFEIERLPSVEEIYLFHGVAKENPSDERLFALAEINDLTPIRDEDGRLVKLPILERVFLEAAAAIRKFQMARPARKRLHWNRIHLAVVPPFEFQAKDLQGVIERLTPAIRGLGLEKVMISCNLRDPRTGEQVAKSLHLSNPTEERAVVQLKDPPTEPLESLSAYTQKVVRLRSRGLVYPYELIDLLTPAKEGVRSHFPPGDFVELDLDESGEGLVEVDRPRGENIANIVVGRITNYTEKVPEGIRRIVLLGDPSRSMGSLAEAECRRIMAALDLAEREDIPLEWYAISAGARIALDTGTENMDWIAAVLKRLIEYTQAGKEVNIVVTGINVGAQPYWNAEATMLMHTRGVLIMTPESAMVLTGKRALDYSGGVSAADNFGIGGYDRVMGPNGQAQYFARNLDEACLTLLRYYDHSYRVPGERFPRRARTTDPVERNVCTDEHGPVEGADFQTIGDIFSDEKNPGRKKPFDIRKVMASCVDRDHEPLERWYGMHDAEIAVVWDAHLGGYPVCLLGLESRPLPRTGFVPADGPEMWTGGTLFPSSSKKVARAINATSGNRPLVVLANLSGFDGSPDSLRRLQLEYGAEIGRAVVNFDGPIVFTVISRYHGGAFVVFSAHLNDQMEVVALEGTHASVIGGAPAAAVVFAREVKNRTHSDPRVRELEERLAAASGPEKIELRVQLGEVTRVVHSEKLGEMATEFDGIHSVQRALQVGSIHRIVPPDQLRPYLVDAIERGVNRTLERLGVEPASAGKDAFQGSSGYPETHAKPHPTTPGAVPTLDA